MHALIAVPTASPRACKRAHTLLKGKEKRAMREKEREGSTKGKGGLYKELQIPTLPPKGPRSGVTFHFNPLISSLGKHCKLIQPNVIAYLLDKDALSISVYGSF